MEDNKRYDMVNIMRIVCALLVMCIHLLAFRSFGNDVYYITSNFLCRIAVPFFFIAAGYFFYSKYEKKGYFKKYLIRLICIYAVASIVQTIAYMPLGFTEAVKEEGAVFLVKTYLVNSVDGTLWFFPALIISILLVYCFLKKNLIKPLVVLSIVLFVIALMGDTYMGIIENTSLINLVDGYNFIFDCTRNGIAFAVPFLTMGVLINKYELNKKIKNQLGIVICAWVIFACEAAVVMKSGIADDYNIYISLALVVPVIFMMSLNSKVTIKAKTSNYMREMSVWMYCFHSVLSMIIYQVFPIQIKNSLLMFLIITAVVMILSYLITLVRLRRKNQVSELSIQK